MLLLVCEMVLRESRMEAISYHANETIKMHVEMYCMYQTEKKIYIVVSILYNIIIFILKQNVTLYIYCCLLKKKNSNIVYVAFIKLLI